jgi:hypothetical protein
VRFNENVEQTVRHYLAEVKARGLANEKKRHT